MQNKREKCDIVQLFKDKKQEGQFVKIQAPMVRYSKLPFRLLCQRHGTDVSYTPMILSSSFHQSPKARLTDFTTNYEEFKNPLIVQFAANDAVDFALATRYVLPYCDAVDLNCGCPQRWAIQERIGAQLLQTRENIDLVVDIIKTYHNSASDNDLVPMTVKIRKLSTEKQTIDLVKQLESTGLVSWLSVHGRTICDRPTNPVDSDMITLVKQNVSLPIVFNGDVFNMQNAREFVSVTNVDGVMSARGLLTNPGLFGEGPDYVDDKKVRLRCIRDFLDIGTSCSDTSLAFTQFHHHIMFMLAGYEGGAVPLISVGDACEFAEITSTAGIIDFFEERQLFNYI
jgi:tRNA-dihydrouridine synthase 4